MKSLGAMAAGEVLDEKRTTFQGVKSAALLAFCAAPPLQPSLLLLAM